MSCSYGAEFVISLFLHKKPLYKDTFYRDKIMNTLGTHRQIYSIFDTSFVQQGRSSLLPSSTETGAIFVAPSKPAKSITAAS